MAMIYIVAYDIANNRRRLKVAKILESWGYRIQESVFQLRRRRHPHLPDLRLLRRPRRHTRRGHSARRRGVVSRSVVRVSGVNTETDKSQSDHRSAHPKEHLVRRRDPTKAVRSFHLFCCSLDSLQE